MDKDKRVIYGTMGLGGGWDRNPVTKAAVTLATEALDTAYEEGIRTYDLADIYQFGKSDICFGKWIKHNKAIRPNLFIQTKASIELPTGQSATQYNWSSDHLVESVLGSLKRTGLSHFDRLLLHRYDHLVDVADLAKVIRFLKDEGLVKSFGVSNMGLAQMTFLEEVTGEAFGVNQLQMSLGHLAFLDHVTDLNTHHQANFPQGVIEAAIMGNMELQAWSPMAQGQFSGNIKKDAPERIFKTSERVEQLSSAYGVSPTSLVLAWLMNHPANIRPVIGTTNKQRIADSLQGQGLRLSRQDWYSLYETARGVPLP